MPATLPILICDIDNVIARTDEVMRDVIRQHSRGKVDLRYEDVVCFDYWECRDRYGNQFGKSEWDAIHTEFATNYVRQLAPFEGVSRQLKNLAKKFSIHLATTRPSVSHEATRQWLIDHQIGYSKLHFVRHREKHLIPEHISVAIDDDCDQAQLFFRSGVRCLVFAHPWNTHCEAGERVIGWDHIVHLLTCVDIPS